MRPIEKWWVMFVILATTSLGIAGLLHMNHLIGWEILGSVMIVGVCGSWLFFMLCVIPERKKSSFEDYLHRSLKAGNIDFNMRAQKDLAGTITFYIHPQNIDGETGDFIVFGYDVRRR